VFFFYKIDFLNRVVKAKEEVKRTNVQIIYYGLNGDTITSSYLISKQAIQIPHRAVIGSITYAMRELMLAKKNASTLCNAVGQHPYFLQSSTVTNTTLNESHYDSMCEIRHW
jgi:hypothetical protein